MNDKDKLEELLFKYHKGTCSHEEKELLELWLKEMEQTGSTELLFQDEEEKNQKQVSMKQNIMGRLHPPTTSATKKLWISVMKTAAIILLTFSAGYFFFSQRQVYLLHKSKNDLVAWDTITTQQGEIKKIMLADQSTLYLSVNSQLRIVPDFGKTSRAIELLSGEAWFDVTKNPSLPFTVKSGRLQTVVLGTQFMVTRFANNKKVEVSVTRGKVRVQDDRNEQNLLPGQAVNYSPEDGQMDLTKQKVAFDPINQRYRLRGCSFKELARRVEDIYGYKLIPANPKVWDRSYTGEIDLGESVRLVLTKFLAIHHSTFEIIGKEVHIK